MIPLLESISQSISLPLELIIIGSLLIRNTGFEKRPKIQKYISPAITSIFFLIAVRTLGDTDESTTTTLSITFLYCLICYAMSLGYIYYTRRIPFLTALYITNITYLIQHFTHSFCLIFLRFTGVSYENQVETIFFFMTFIVVYWLLGKRLTSSVEKTRYSPKESLTTALVLGVAIFLSAIAKQESLSNNVLYYVCNGYAMIFCFYALYVEVQKRQREQLERKLLIEEQTFIKYKEQYEISQENIDLINRKCHDLKHQITALKQINNEELRNAQISELEQAVMIYDAIVHTGNNILDTILTEKSLFCEANGIQMVCVADGQAVEGIDPIDLYTIFGNALDNCLECVTNAKADDQKVISVIVTKKSDMIFFQFENYYEEINLDENGTLSTTKEDTDYHGFGLESIKHTAEKYGGFVDIETHNNVFLLRVMIPA